MTFTSWQSLVRFASSGPLILKGMNDMKMFDNVKKGDEVTIHDHNGRLLRIAHVTAVTATQFTAGHTYLKTGKEKGGVRIARPTDTDKIAAAQAELDQRDREADEAEDRRRQAEYDALPESIKLGRSLQWICDCTSEKKIAEAPIELLRSIVEWAKRENLTTE
jgi:hypothetical protein